MINHYHKKRDYSLRITGNVLNNIKRKIQFLLTVYTCHYNPITNREVLKAAGIVVNVRNKVIGQIRVENTC
jgi:hypothetical protein